MYRFKSTINPTELKRRYLKEYNVNLLQRKLEVLLKAYPDLKIALPNNLSARRLLIGDFKYLAKVYWAFTDYLKGKEDRTIILQAFVNGGFNYDSHKKDIRCFLMNAANGFEIHNCVYCDLEDLTSFTKANGQVVRRFDSEHVLDKGECPLVALSLYNFVPSCGTCNGPDIKGTKTVGDTEYETVRLSPSAEGYNFEDNVRFEVNMINPAAEDSKECSHPYDYKVGFCLKDKLYQKSIDLFELESRYNQDKVKNELLKWREKRRKYPDNIVREFAVMVGVPFAEQFEIMFELRRGKQNHYIKEKARRDIMLIRE